jgi:hypothetical protein
MTGCVKTRGSPDAFNVMPGLVPGIHAVRRRVDIGTSMPFSAPLALRLELAMHVPTWMPGTSPGVTRMANCKRNIAG